jgi:hypothetical protein
MQNIFVGAFLYTKELCCKCFKKENTHIEIEKQVEQKELTGNAKEEIDLPVGLQRIDY